MTKIKVSVSRMKNILTTIKLSGKSIDKTNTDLIMSCMLEAKENYLMTNVIDVTCVVFSRMKFKNISVLEGGNIPIGSITGLLSYLDRFNADDEIIISTDESKIKITRETPKKTANIPMITEEGLEEYTKAKSVIEKLQIMPDKAIFSNSELNTSIIVDAKDIKGFIDDGNVEKLRVRYPIKITADKITCVVGEERTGFIETEIPFIAKTGTAYSVFAAGIDNVFNNLEGQVKIWLGDNKPMIVLKNDDNIELQAVIAPVAEE